MADTSPLKRVSVSRSCLVILFLSPSTSAMRARRALRCALASRYCSGVVMSKAPKSLALASTRSRCSASQRSASVSAAGASMTSASTSIVFSMSLS